MTLFWCYLQLKETKSMWLIYAFNKRQAYFNIRSLLSSFGIILEYQFNISELAVTFSDVHRFLLFVRVSIGWFMRLVWEANIINSFIVDPRWGWTALSDKQLLPQLNIRICNYSIVSYVPRVITVNSSRTSSPSHSTQHSKYTWGRSACWPGRGQVPRPL